MITVKKIFGDTIEYAASSYSALENADALLLVTEWNEFRRPDFERIKSLLKNPVIFDGNGRYERTFSKVVVFSVIFAG